VTGWTFSKDFPVTRNACQPLDPSMTYSVFYSKINPNKLGDASLLYSTYLNGTKSLAQGWGEAMESP